MAIFKKKKENDLSTASSESIDKMILEAETDLSVLEKERDRKKKRYDDLFKEGAESSGARRESIAQDLEFVEKEISDIDRRMRKYRKALGVMKETKRAKATGTDNIDKITEETSGAQLKGVITKGRVREKFQENKMNQLLNSISDIDALDEEEETSGKYMKMFEEMDRNREKLMPGETGEPKNNTRETKENAEDSAE